ncbi:MAG TPA: hypothetical protein VEW92_07310 [Nitrososphaeraceae archaeon]|nr:hypothetical protein [Nitrososphaeraceae archaeon]
MIAVLKLLPYVLYLIPAGVPDYNIHVLANYNDNDLNLLMDLVWL